MRELLERAGHDVVEAGDGSEGLRVFFSSQPDLVVLDVSMPGLDGWGTLERIRELSDVPVVMLTAQARELAKVRGLRGGADDYVTKPFGRQELLARVEANLRRQRSDTDAPVTYSDGFVTIDFAQRAVRVGENELSLTVRKVMRQYFKDLDGEKASGIYDMVVLAVEKPMLEVVMFQAQGNQTRAAELLGMNRNTLHQKLSRFGADGEAAAE